MQPCGSHPRITVGVLLTKVNGMIFVLKSIYKKLSVRKSLLDTLLGVLEDLIFKEESEVGAYHPSTTYTCEPPHFRTPGTTHKAWFQVKGKFFLIKKNSRIFAC